jgi:uncharacterized protein (DUF433 family)
MKYEGRITVDPGVLHGKPVVRGTRIPVYVILRLLANETSVEEILQQYPDLVREDVLAALEYAAFLAENDEVGALEALS